MRVGIIDLLVDSPTRGPVEALYAAYFRKQFMSLMPQVVAAWCRRLGHTVRYATYYGQSDPLRLLPDDLDVVFVSVYTQASALAYALARLYRRRRVLTVIGGPHARSFPTDCQRFFDVVVRDCDERLIAEILAERRPGPAILSSGRPLTDIPSVEERMPEIAASAFIDGRPTRTSLVPLLSSIGCPYACDFCLDWNSAYVALPPERLRADLGYLSRNLPQLLVGYHDPNFAVRFDETMDAIEAVPGPRNRYIMESSLSILKPARLARLKATNCIYVAPGVESWSAYSDKAAAGAKQGRDKLEAVVAHFALLGRFVPGLQANFLFGTDVDRGEEPASLTKEFIRRLPGVFPAVNIPTPFGGTPLFERYLGEGRVLATMPFAFYYNPYLVTTLKNYDPVEYYDHLIDIHRAAVTATLFVRRLARRGHGAIKFIHALRTAGLKRDLGEFVRLRRRLASDRGFRAFHEGRSPKLPAYYRERLRGRLGAYAELLSAEDLAPVLR